MSSNETTLEALSQKFNLPAIDLKFYKPEADAICLIPENFAHQWKLLPLSRVGSTLTICVANPSLALHAIDGARFCTGLHVEVIVALSEDLEAAISRFYEDEKVEERLDALVASALNLPDIRRARKIAKSSLTARAFYVGELERQPTYEQALSDCLKPRKEGNNG